MKSNFTKCHTSGVLRDGLKKGLHNKESSDTFRKNLRNFAKPGGR